MLGSAGLLFWRMLIVELANRCTLSVVIRPLWLSRFIKLGAGKFIKYSIYWSHWSLRLVVEHPRRLVNDFETWFFSRASTRFIQVLNIAIQHLLANGCTAFFLLLIFLPFFAKWLLDGIILLILLRCFCCELICTYFAIF